MALGSTQPLTEMSTRNILGGKGRPARRADNLAAIYVPIVYKMWEPQNLTTLWAPAACYRDSFTLLYFTLLRVNMAQYLSWIRHVAWNVTSDAIKI
jgi:hypothetical protein